ncbi:hypothetical protein PF005_g30253 [Phytophthora fragariae]|nr:hypothetical protein PF005_g30253 [Phytophthora fragariae]
MAKNNFSRKSSSRLSDGSDLKNMMVKTGAHEQDHGLAQGNGQAMDLSDIGTEEYTRSYDVGQTLGQPDEDVVGDRSSTPRDVVRGLRAATVQDRVSVPVLSVTADGLEGAAREDADDGDGETSYSLAELVGGLAGPLGDIGLTIESRA